MNGLMEKQQKVLLKKFHTLLGKAGIGEEGKRELLATYGVFSSRDLSARDLLDLCDRIDRMMRPDAAELDKWRKRVIAAIFGWRKAMGDTSSMAEVKAIACRAAEAKYYNAIPLDRLRSLYYAFSKKTKDLEFVEKLTIDELDIKTWVN
ncbi:MAG TPA: hypothetical protein DEG28_00965 [Porphyromonadaceae bacterium]|nr:hypothetical protein [Porphyromonadaceae bacterium]